MIQSCVKWCKFHLEELQEQVKDFFQSLKTHVLTSVNSLQSKPEAKAYYFLSNVYFSTAELE